MFLVFFKYLRHKPRAMQLINKSISKPKEAFKQNKPFAQDFGNSLTGTSSFLWQTL
jgi:hypothetical protein